MSLSQKPFQVVIFNQFKYHFNKSINNFSLLNLINFRVIFLLLFQFKNLTKSPVIYPKTVYLFNVYNL